MKRYRRLTLELPADREDELAAILWSLGPLGLEIAEAATGSRIEAYFEDEIPAGAERLIRDWLPESVRIRSREVLEEDWLATFREAAAPIAVGRRWLVDPGEPGFNAPEVGDRELLRIPARRAFGIGSHESTRLILEWLEALDLEGLRILDLGSGSGILSIAAERMGAARVVGVDIDEVACFVAVDNRRLNGGSFSLVAGDLASLRALFDVALVNILPSEWIHSARELATQLAIGGLGLFSGVPRADREEVESALARAGLRCVDSRIEGEWVALAARREDR